MIGVAVLCAALYLALTRNPEPANIAVAAIFGAGVAWVTREQNGRRTRLATVPGRVYWAVRFVLFLVVDIVRCGINVARIILNPRLPIRPGVVHVNSGSNNEVVTVLSAHAITITPGEQVIGFEQGNQMTVHCLDAVASGQSADSAQAVRRKMLENIFGRGD